MKSLNQFFAAQCRAALEETVWFRGASAAQRRQAKVKVLGIEERQFSSMFGSQLRPALVFEVTQAGIKGRFVAVLGDLGAAECVEEDVA
jgi:hypothetical protein